jgi:hypothetical protein
VYFGGIRYAQAVSKTIFQTVLTEVAGYVVFVPKDGTVSGGEIDVEEFLDFPNVVRLKNADHSYHTGWRRVFRRVVDGWK